MTADATHTTLEKVYRTESRRVLATLIRLLGSFDAAEEGVHEAFAAAAATWPQTGLPANPYAWLVSTGRFRVIDRWRRQSRLDKALPELVALNPAHEVIAVADDMDDQLRLIFMCCHPNLAPDSRVALTLREIAGLTTEAIAAAYLTPAPTIAQRIVRAKAKIRDSALPYEVPEPSELPQRLDSVLQVIYLIFNAGYAAADGTDFIRHDLCAEAIRLGRLVTELLDDSEALGLLALMLLHDARQSTRLDPSGDIVLLEDQDRTQWNRPQIAEAQGLIERALTARRVGPYILQAAIAELHSAAPSFNDTDWPQITGLYDVLLRIAPSPVIALNRAVAIGQRDGPAAGLAELEAVMARGGLDTYALAFAAKADLQRRLGLADFEVSYRRALELSHHPAERRFLIERLSSNPL